MPLWTKHCGPEPFNGGGVFTPDLRTEVINIHDTTVSTATDTLPRASVRNRQNVGETE
ncbi:hypothetical protein Pure05_41000 [Paenarthrobacter ureafaciens]|nr:hypothetical protein Pure05_41000 [Paenarthrobacter ureafaciens]